MTYRVPWSELAVHLAKAIQLREGDLSQACIKTLLSEGETHDKLFPDRAGEVTVEQWGKFLGWFGPFDAQMPAKVLMHITADRAPLTLVPCLDPEPAATAVVPRHDRDEGGRGQASRRRCVRALLLLLLLSHDHLRMPLTRLPL